MRVLIGLENNTERRSIAWALDYPGCFAYGVDGPIALVSAPQALVAYQAWIAGHDPAAVPELGDFDVRLAEVWEGYSINDRYDLDVEGREVNAWFRHDWKPLQAEEVARGLRLLEWSRTDLLATVAGLPDDRLDAQYPKERLSIRGLLRHVANAEWWYLDRLDLAGCEREALPENELERLAYTRTRLNAVLPELVGAEKVLGKQGEFWGPRKLLRRVLWHEIDHREHIRKLLVASD